MVDRFLFFFLIVNRLLFVSYSFVLFGCFVTSLVDGKDGFMHFIGIWPGLHIPMGHCSSRSQSILALDHRRGFCSVPIRIIACVIQQKSQSTSYCKSMEWRKKTEIQIVCTRSERVFATQHSPAWAELYGKPTLQCGCDQNTTLRDS